MTSIKARLLRGESPDSIINADIDAHVREVASATDWAGLIAKAMEANPDPLKAAMYQVHGRKDLYPPEMLAFLQLMAENVPKQGRPPKDGKEALRAAAKAWRMTFLRDNYKVLRELAKRVKHFDAETDQRMTVESKAHKVSVRVSAAARGRKALRLANEKPSELALQWMADAEMGGDVEALRNELYPRKKKVQQKQ